MQRTLIGSLVVTAGLWSGGVAAQPVAEILAPKSGKVLFVSPDGNNGNEGSKDKPLKNLDKALKKAAKGDTIAVAEGTYKGTFGVGFWFIENPVKLYGGFSKDFSARDPKKHPSILQPAADRFEKASVKNLVETKSAMSGLVVDGFVFDEGVFTPYHPTEGKPAGVESGMMKVGPGSKNSEPVCLVVAGNDITVRNNVFVNCAGGGLRVKHGQAGKGDIEVANNIFVASRMSAIDAYGTENNPGTINIHHNTIVFTWSRLKDFGSLGYGVNIGTRTAFNIHHNVIALNIGAGVSSQKFNKEIRMDENLFFGNKKKDFWFNPASNTDVKINAEEFGDLELPSVKGNKNANTRLGLEKAYVEGFISAQYSEKVDYDPESQANLMRELFGLNKRGKLETKVSMFANRYPWKNTLELWGAVKDVGAQAPQ